MAKLTELMRLDGKKALVTGAAGHVGPVAAQVLLELGAEVVISDRDLGKLSAKGRELGLDDQHWISADLTHDRDMASLPRWAADRMGDLDILVHCAALTGTGADPRRIGWSVPFLSQSVSSFRYSLDLNLVAPFVFGQEMAEQHLDDQNGVMVLLGSIYGLVAPQRSLYENIQGVGEAPAGYSAAKGGVVALTRHLAAVLAPNVRVNSLVPGGLLRGQPAEFVRRYAERTPLGRMGTEDDLRGPLTFLCSGMSSYMTGQTIQVDGGWTIW